MPSGESYISTEELGAEEIKRRAAKKRYENLSEADKARLESEFKSYFKIDIRIKNALELLKSGKATNESEAEQILAKEEFDDRLDQYH